MRFSEVTTESSHAPGLACGRSGFYVVGGRQRPPAFRRPEWKQYDQAVILFVDPITSCIEQVAEYVSMPEACPWDQQPSILFKAGTRIGDLLYACTSTEVLVYSLPSFEPLHYISHPYFNDVHHVTVTQNGELVVVNTGLDMVMVMSVSSGEVLAEYNVCNEPTWDRFSRTEDYRKVLSTRPHKSHPNYAFFLDKDLWVTRFEDKDAICLSKPGERIEIGENHPHDGMVRYGKLYFTTVDGRILIVDVNTKRLERTIDLNRITKRPKALGWCRALEVLQPGIVVVGFTKLRRTKFHERLIWVKERFGGDLLLSEPTRIAAYDLDREVLLWEIPLDGDACGLNTIFSIHRV